MIQSTHFIGELLHFAVSGAANHLLYHHRHKSSVEQKHADDECVLLTNVTHYSHDSARLFVAVEQIGDAAQHAQTPEATRKLQLRDMIKNKKDLNVIQIITVHDSHGTSGNRETAEGFLAFQPLL